MVEIKLLAFLAKIEHWIAVIALYIYEVDIMNKQFFLSVVYSYNFNNYILFKKFYI